MTQRDTQQLLGLLDPELLYIHSNGLTETRSEHIHAIAAGTLVYEAMSRVGEGRVFMASRKIAVTNGDVAVKGILKGNAFSVTLRYTAIYRRHKGTWRLLRWQSTRLP